MKKILVICLFLTTTVWLCGQNTFKYEVRIPSLRVGGITKVKIDSITADGDTIRFFSGTTELLPKGAAIGETGTVTSVGLSVPTGLAVNNSPITTSGELALSFASGYSIPTTAKQTEWDNAYTNRVTSASGTAPLNLSLSSNAITGTIDQASTSSAGTMSAADKLKLDHMKDSIEKALDDAFGVGAELSNLVVMREDSLGATNEFYVPVYAFIQAMQNQVHVADSNKTSSGNYITNKKLVDYVAANQGSAAGVTLNGGTLTLTGDGGTADNVTIYTNGDGQYEYPAGGGILTRMGDVQDWISDSLKAARRADSDTIPLFVFGIGSGHSADTALFNNDRLAGAFYNSGSDTLYVTELRGVLVEGTGTETVGVQISWHANMLDTQATSLNTSALTINNMTTGTSDTSFDNNGIPPGRWVWCKLSGASSGNKPTMLVLTMTGYKRNRSY